MDQPFCAFCYAPVAQLRFCGLCQQRGYCSKECQKRDWKEASHKKWCGAAGEIGIDWDLRPCGGDKGLGVFALREFRKNDLIMVEGPILRLSNRDVPELSQIQPSAHQAAMALAPNGIDFLPKFRLNGMACSSSDGPSGDTGLFLSISRIKHDYLGNAEHLYLIGRDV